MGVHKRTKWIGVALLTLGVMGLSLLISAPVGAGGSGATMSGKVSGASGAHSMLGTPLAQGQDAGSANAPDSKLYLPDHHYDLPATYVSAAQIQAHKLKMIADKKDDVPINMVKIGGAGDKHQAGISIVYREPGVFNAVAVHDDVAEVYYMMEGSGTMLLGGKLVDPRRRSVSSGNGMGLSAQKSAGAQEFNLAAGDMLIVPAGTPHQWEKVNEFTAYAVVRVDPDGVTPLLK